MPVRSSLIFAAGVALVALRLISCAGNPATTKDSVEHGSANGNAGPNGGTVAATQSAGGITVPEALHNMFALMGKYRRYVDDGELPLIHNYDLVLNRSVNSLFEQSSASAQGKEEALKSAILGLNRTLLNLHAASHVSDTATSRVELSKAILQVDALREFYDEATWREALEYAEPCACPMHPEVTGKGGDLCSKCRMNLEPVGILERVFQKRPPLRATLVPDVPLRPGSEVRSRLLLAQKDGTPVLPGELREFHTKKIHLLIVDSSLSDYSHVHPVPTGVPGEYAFSFTPRSGGVYRAWADVVPDVSGRQEYVTTDFPVVSGNARQREHPLSLRTSVDGIRYELRFDRQEIVAGQGVGMHLRIVREDGTPFTELEPLMGAFAHVVGFYEDFHNVTHIHPIGAVPRSPGDRGGPELEFHFYTTTPGYLKLFAQVQIGGVSKYAPFGVMIHPAQ